MEQDTSKPNGSSGTSEQPASDQYADLKKKQNIDQSAIDEAIEAVGDEEEKVREYLINNRGL